MKYEYLKALGPAMFTLAGMIGITAYIVFFGQFQFYTLRAVSIIFFVAFIFMAAWFLTPLYYYRTISEIKIDCNKEEFLDKREEISKNQYELMANEFDLEYEIKQEKTIFRPKSRNLFHKFLGSKKSVIRIIEDFEESGREVSVVETDKKIIEADFGGLKQVENSVKLKINTYGLHRVNISMLELTNDKNLENKVEAIQESGLEVSDSELKIEASLKPFDIPEKDLLEAIEFN